jgi:hypothetical protein
MFGEHEKPNTTIVRLREIAMERRDTSSRPNVILEETNGIVGFQRS